MNPTELYKYKPLLKRIKTNIHTLSQIEGLPGNIINNDNQRRKSGKKLFVQKNIESKENRSRNNCLNKIKYANITMYHQCRNNKTIYEYDAPTISHVDMNNKKN